MKTKRILWDFDQILAHCNRPWLARYYDITGHWVPVEKVETWAMHEYCTDLTSERLYAILDEPGFVAEQEPLDGALEALRTVREMGYTISICTTSTGMNNELGKIEWLHRYGIVDLIDDIIFTKNKHKIGHDIIIDDKPTTLAKCQDAGSTTITIDYPYNREVEVSFRAMDYAEPARAWAQIVDYIGKL